MRQKVLSTCLVAALLAVMTPLSLAQAAATTTSVTVNGSSSTTVAAGGNVTINVNVTTNGDSSEDDWRSTAYRFGSSGGYTCVNTDDNTGDGNYSESFTVSAPGTNGTYNLSVIAYVNSGCGGGGGNTLTLTNAVTVTDSRTTVSATLNGASTVTVAPGATISANVVGTILGGADWDGTQWRVSATAPGSMTCVNTSDTSSSGTHDRTFNITAPMSAGTYNAYFRITGEDDCDGQLGTLLTLTNAIVVDGTTPSVTINQAEGQDDPTYTPSIEFDVLFSEPVTGFVAGDVSFAGSTAGGTLVAAVSGSGASYTVTVTGMTTAGAVVASLPAGAATDGTFTSSASTSVDNSVQFLVNSVPTAATQTVTTPFETPILITLFGSDVEDALANLVFEESDSNVTLETLPNIFEYTPSPSTWGTDTFDYRVCDTQEACSAWTTITVEVQPEDEEPVDVCPEDPGVQTSLEDCTPEPVDVCPEVDGVQTSLEECETEPVDVCPELDGLQTSLEECETEPEDACPEMDGIQESVEECTPTEPGTGTILIKKEALGGNGIFTFNVFGEAFNEDVSFETFDGSGEQSISVPTGTYEVTEDAFEGWTNTSVSCVSGESSYPNNYVEVADGQTVTCTFSNTRDGYDPNAPEDTGGEGGRYTKNIHGNDNGGEVLGESTEDSCTMLLDTYLYPNGQNDAQEVMDLQTFLNGEMSATLTVNGTYDAATTEAVHAFQAKYWEEVLKPWFSIPGSGIDSQDDTTGVVYKTTRWKINNLSCAGSEQMPILP